MLIDEIEATISAGNGGKGAVSFGRYLKSGPDGGNGGKGGDVYIEGSSDLTLLAQFRVTPVVQAPHGVNGGKDKMSGKNATDLTLFIPVGTQLFDKETQEKFEIKDVGERFLICRGGAGGVGNFDLRSSRNTTPTKSIPAKKGESRNLTITLSFIADYGLIGLPSAGKSSLLNALTNTKVKTAEYHFTTLTANLGVLPNRQIIADIPGLIEGAHEGKGLGIRFLKHVQKVRILLHCISSDSQDPMKDYEVVRHELGEFSEDLLEKEEIILVTKSDLVKEEDLKVVVNKLKSTKRKVLTTSIYDEKLINKLSSILQ